MKWQTLTLYISLKVTIMMTITCINEWQNARFVSEKRQTALHMYNNYPNSGIHSVRVNPSTHTLELPNINRKTMLLRMA